MSNFREQLGNIPSQFKSGNVASWSHQEVHIPSNALVTVHFDSTKPNMFMLQNPNQTVIHVGLSRIPTVTNYEFKIEANSSATFGRPISTDVLYLLNKGNTEVSVTLFSVADTFEMSILQSLNVDLSSTPIFDGIITGFSNGVSLPQGNNKIGSVDVINQILKKLYSDTLISQTTAQTVNVSGTNYINFISNDGTSDVIVGLISPSGTSNITLKAGETINDIAYSVSSIKFTPISGEYSVRYLCGER